MRWTYSIGLTPMLEDTKIDLVKHGLTGSPYQTIIQPKHMIEAYDTSIYGIGPKSSKDVATSHSSRSSDIVDHRGSLLHCGTSIVSHCDIVLVAWQPQMTSSSQLTPVHPWQRSQSPQVMRAAACDLVCDTRSLNTVRPYGSCVLHIWHDSLLNLSFHLCIIITCAHPSHTLFPFFSLIIFLLFPQFSLYSHFPSLFSCIVYELRENVIYFWEWHRAFSNAIYHISD